MNTIKVPQTGRQIDSYLRAILGVLDAAPDHSGQVLYIHGGQIDYATGEDLFGIIPLEET